jgi:xylulokinase
MTINTGKPELIKAILEGITYEMMVNLERLHEAGIEADELRAVGGLARSAQFLQLKADMMGKRIVSLHVSEAGTLGVAILAAAATGIYPSLEAAVAKLVQPKQVFLPDDGQHARYAEQFERYKRLYPAVKTILR